MARSRSLLKYLRRSRKGKIELWETGGNDFPSVTPQFEDDDIALLVLHFQSCHGNSYGILLFLKSSYIATDQTDRNHSFS